MDCSLPSLSLRRALGLAGLLTALVSLEAQPTSASSAAAQAEAKPTPKPPKLIPPVQGAEVQLPPGFKIELLYTVPREEQGSWVSMTVDPQGRLILGDQYGGLYRVTVPAIGSSEGLVVEPLKVDVFGAHGLLYAFNSLYVMVNEREPQGLYRLKDLDGQGNYGAPEFLRGVKWGGGGEHGTHGLALSPDGKSIYFANGNHTDLPSHLEKSRAVAWGEDHLLPRLWDARGHAKGRFAPGGYVARTDPDGRTVELFSLGFRNEYDIAFDQNGELFTYDSDMEWDIGTPWYLPTRVNHVVDGGDYGWRSGAGRWPSYYADSLPAVVDIGPGSPTGVAFGTGAKFPAKYQRAFFINDWTYGTMYAVHLQPDGATFKAKVEEFVASKPLPLTDLLIHPKDGAMYFATGGRRTQSALYRVTYVGRESTAPVKALPPTKEARQRHELEALHTSEVNPAAIDQAWPYLNSSDRFLRFAARVAIERQPVASWAERALAETKPMAAIEALMALARMGEATLQPRLLAALEKLNFPRMSPELRLPLLRVWELAFTRMGKPDAATCARLAARMDGWFPGRDAFENRELASLLVYLDSPTAVKRLVPLLSVAEKSGNEAGSAAVIARNDNYASAVSAARQSRPDRQQMAYAYALRNATVGWTPALRLEFFSWFSRTRSWRGGASFNGFIQNIRNDSLEKVTDTAERAALDALSKPVPPEFAAAAITPQGPGRAYTVADALAVMPAKLKNRDFARGQAMFTATGCILCHRFGADGGGIGPDLTGSGNRYTVRDLLANIIEPSAVISDQYGSEQLDLIDGSTIIGRVVGEENGQYQVAANPFMPEDKTLVKADQVKSRKVYPLSMMPPGLINGLNGEELKDLVAYVLSGGNPQDPMFKQP